MTEGAEPQKGAREARAVRPLVISDEPAKIHVPVAGDPARLLRSTSQIFLGFRSAARAAVAARVDSLESLAAALRHVPAEAIDNALYSRDLERWVGEVLGDAELAREIRGLRTTAPFGEAARTSLHVLVKSRLDALAAVGRE